MRCSVTGAGGMVGGYLVARLLKEGNDVLASDIKPKEQWYQCHEGARNLYGYDLSTHDVAKKALFHEGDEVYLLAANMGGIGFITQQPLECILSVDITSSILKAARDLNNRRVFYSSSACAYPIDIQQDIGVPALKESDIWKGRPEYGYGEEKLFGESICEFIDRCTDTKTRVGRYHNMYAPAYTTYKGGREKAPAALCRKVAEAVVFGSNQIEIWGDGEQTRSFCYIDDCIEGTIRLMRSDYNKPLNIGSHELVSINQLVDIIEEIAGTHLKRTYNFDAPQGVRGRNSDNTLIKKVLDWEPSIKLEEGLIKTYEWIFNEIKSGKTVTI